MQLQAKVFVANRIEDCKNCNDFLTAKLFLEQKTSNAVFRFGLVKNLKEHAKSN